MLTQRVWRPPRHTPLAFLLQGQLCLWSSHRRRRRVLLAGKSQGAHQGPPHRLRAAERWQRLGSCFATPPLRQPHQTP